MGLFDSFYDVFKCPRCGYKTRVDFQTKSLQNAMLSFKVGDRLAVDGLKINSGLVSCYGSLTHKCRNAWYDVRLDGNARIDGGRFAGVKVSKIGWKKMKVLEEDPKSVQLIPFKANPKNPSYTVYHSKNGEATGRRLYVIDFKKRKRNS